MQPGTEELLVGLLMIDRPRSADPEWLAEVEATFGECELIAMTPVGQPAGAAWPDLKRWRTGHRLPDADRAGKPPPPAPFPRREGRRDTDGPATAACESSQARLHPPLG